MTLRDFERILGVAGVHRPNPAPDKSIVDFDLDHKWVIAAVPGSLSDKDDPDPSDAEPKVIEFRVITDKLTVEERQARRWEKWAEWVEAHTPKHKAGPEPEDEL